ncbi:hypothetical protein Rmet_4249 (plasmid) [Cupriavidus metallidurans CH34]|uniref:Uncharacterized protein n=1 Tax=Cupriavidus metallidurans (strain ATCC 43123 / DSM 2839 / NBRC 102507 / CH34) TaxID=266264 RepID=Q1LFG1_CUPMC|nr:hypothetical protein Rmet_4249 [Cupriavidus metallidurans CH34]
MENGVSTGMLDAMVADLSGREIAERYAASLSTEQCHCRPALQAWLAKEWPALGLWSAGCRHRRRHARNRLANRSLQSGALQTVSV